MANIREIAKIAGVSVSTVSRVLNGHPYVREEKRRAVTEAINKLDYAPNRKAVQLTTGRSDTVGVVMPAIDHPYYARILEGVSRAALKAGYQLLMVQTAYDAEAERRALELIRTKQVDGLILASNMLDWREIAPYSSYGPLLACGEPAVEGISAVYVDHYACFADALRYLIRRGRRRIGFTLARPDSANSRKRRQAYDDVLSEAGLVRRDEWRFEQCRTAFDGAAIARRLMGARDRPDALIVTGDLAAVGFIAEARRIGLRVPEDIAVVGFDNQPIADVFGLTTMDIGLPEMGGLAFETVLARIRDREAKPVSRQLAYRLIERFTV